MIGSALIALAVHFPHLGVHIHKLHGPSFDYAGLALAAFASWVGVPGPGEPVLVAAAILAAKHKLALGDVLVVAFTAAAAGGVVGWLIGMKAGRGLLSGRGPLRRLRRRTLEYGDRLFASHPVIAIVLAPAFSAGIHRVPTATYLIVNAVSVAIWTLGLGLGAYLAGPAVLDWFGDIGTAASIGVGVAIAVVVTVTSVRRRRRAAV